MNDIESAKSNLGKARKIAAELYGENPSPEIVSAVLNSITAQQLSSDIRDAAAQVSNALFQTSR